MIRTVTAWAWLALFAWQWAWLFALPPPSGPGNPWLAAAACLPLLILLPGVWRRNPRALAWAGFVSLPYFILGIMEAWSNPPQRVAALVQTVLAGGFLLLVSAGARRRRTI